MFIVMYLYYVIMILFSFCSLMKVMKALKKKVQLIMVKNVYQMVRKKYTFVFQGNANSEVAHTITSSK